MGEEEPGEGFKVLTDFRQQHCGQLVIVHLLQFRNGLEFAGLAGPDRVEIGRDVNAALLERVDQIIKLVEVLRVGGGRIGRELLDDVAVVMVEADRVVSDPAQPFRQQIRLFPAEVVGPEAEVGAVETHRLVLLFKDELAVLHLEEAVLAGRRIQQKREVERGTRNDRTVGRKRLPVIGTHKTELHRLRDRHPLRGGGDGDDHPDRLPARLELQRRKRLVGNFKT